MYTEFWETVKHIFNSKIGFKVSFIKKDDVNLLCKFPSLLHTIIYSVLITEFIGNSYFHVHFFPS